MTTSALYSDATAPLTDPPRFLQLLSILPGPSFAPLAVQLPARPHFAGLSAIDFPNPRNSPLAVRVPPGPPRTRVTVLQQLGSMERKSQPATRTVVANG
jgi:hypothetical protein